MYSNNCFIQFLKLQNFEARNTSEKAKKARKSERNRKKTYGDAMLYKLPPRDQKDVGSSQNDSTQLRQVGRSKILTEPGFQ